MVVPLMEMELWQLLSAHSRASPPSVLKTAHIEVSGNTLHRENRCQLALSESCISAEADRKDIFCTLSTALPEPNIESFSVAGGRLAEWEWLLSPHIPHLYLFCYCLICTKNSSSGSWECQHLKWAMFDITRVNGTGIRPMDVCIETDLYRN